MGDRVRLFVRQECQDNDDAVLLNISKDALVAEVLQAAIPLLFSKGEEPPVGKLALRIDGKVSALKNRSRIGDSGADFTDETFVVEVRDVTPAPSVAGSVAHTTPPRQRSVKLASPDAHYGVRSPQTPRSQMITDYNTMMAAAYTTPPTQKSRPMGGYSTPRSGRNLSMPKSKSAYDNINPQSAGILYVGSPEHDEHTAAASKGKGSGYFSPNAWDAATAAEQLHSPSPRHGAGKAGGDVDMVFSQGKHISAAGYDARVGSCGADFSRLAYGEAQDGASPITASKRRPSVAYPASHQQSPCEDEYAYATGMGRQTSQEVSSMKWGSGGCHLASAARSRRSRSKGRGGCPLDGRAGGSGASVAALATGRSTHADDAREGRRPCPTGRTVFDSQVTLTARAEEPPGDAQALLSGTVYSQTEPPRVRRVAPPQDSGWWGHEGGYGASPETTTQRAHGVPSPAGGGGGDIINGCSPCPQSPSPTRFIDKDKLGTGVDGGVTRTMTQPPMMHGKRLIPKPEENLQHNMTCDGVGRTGGLRITPAGLNQGRPAGEDTRSPHGLGPGLRNKFRESKVPLGGEGIFRPSPDRPPSDTYKSSVGHLMMREDIVSTAPEDTIEELMKRKGRPNDAGFHMMEAPPLAPQTPGEFKQALIDKVGACSSQRHGGELQAAWRQVSQHTGALSKDAFCAAVARELRIEADPYIVDEVLGYDTDTIAFKDFCTLCTEAVPAYQAQTGREHSGVRILNSAHGSRAPYGTDADAPPPRKSVRRTF